MVTDRRGLSEFWPAARDMGIVSDDSERVRLKSDRDLLLGLRRVSAPAPGKNRVHLDLSTKDRPTGVGRLVGLDASVVEQREASGMAWTVLADPGCDVFCVGAEG